MLFSGKENVFMCLVAFQKIFRKIFSDVWLCSWKYHRKHIFYLFLTFSRLPNEYIISFIPQNTNKTQKKIIKSGHFAWSRSARCRWCWQMISASSALDDLYSLFFLSPSLSLSLALSLSLSLSFIFEGQKSFEVKMETEMIFHCFGSYFRSTRNAFQFNRIWSNNQTPHFPENHFRNQFEVNSNAT